MHRFVRDYCAAKNVRPAVAIKKYRRACSKFGGPLDVLWKYTLGPKRKELGAQLADIVSGVWRGYGLGGIGGWTDFAWDHGMNLLKVTVPLSSLILWHPVRGPGERAEAGVKTTQRSEAFARVLRNSLLAPEARDPSVPVVTFTRDHPLTYEQLNRMPEMRSDDIVKVCPVNITPREFDDDVRQRSEHIESLWDRIHALENAPEVTRRTTNQLRALTIEVHDFETQLADILYHHESTQQHFLILSGQGRIQAMFEAVRAAGIDPSTVFLRVDQKNVYLDICNALISIHNMWVREGKFDDERHHVWVQDASGGRYMKMGELGHAFSCSRYRSKVDTRCLARYRSGHAKSKFMGCRDIYGYEIPVERTFTS